MPSSSSGQMLETFMDSHPERFVSDLERLGEIPPIPSSQLAPADTSLVRMGYLGGLYIYVDQSSLKRRIRHIGMHIFSLGRMHDFP